jgi:hypothetical protein
MYCQIHLMIATSLSMMMTFILYCILKNIPPRHSFLQEYLINIQRDYGLLLRCFIDRRTSINL